jgi:hypothetical protein
MTRERFVGDSSRFVVSIEALVLVVPNSSGINFTGRRTTVGIFFVPIVVVVVVVVVVLASGRSLFTARLIKAKSYSKSFKESVFFYRIDLKSKLTLEGLSPNAYNACVLGVKWKTRCC